MNSRNIHFKKLKFILLIPIAYIAFLLLIPTPSTTQKGNKVANDIYKYNCSMCHGGGGNGTGPTAGALPVSPPNWTNPNWQASITDVGIRNAIVYGGKYNGRSDFMPAHPHLKDTEELDELVKLIRDFVEY